MNDQQDNEAMSAPGEELARREPAFNLPPVVLALIGVCAVVYLVCEYALSEQQYFLVLQYAAFIPVRYSGQLPVDLSTFAAPITYSLLHGSAAHIVINMIWLAAFGSPLANRLGMFRFLSFWAITSVAAAAFYWLLHMSAPVVLVGASGAISGMMGAAARFGFRIDRSHGAPGFSGRPLPIAVCLRSRAVVTFLSIWMLINLATGLLPFTPGVDDQIAWEAHIGGFLAGFFGIDWFDRRERKEPEPPDPAEDGEEAAN
jgi:membrane associated rhomboid family serine protease